MKKSTSSKPVFIRADRFDVSRRVPNGFCPSVVRVMLSMKPGDAWEVPLGGETLTKRRNGMSVPLHGANNFDPKRRFTTATRDGKLFLICSAK